MSNFFRSSIGKKLIMSVSGLFLVVFLLVHLSLNLLILFDSSGHLYNEAVHFMGTNPLIRIVEPLLFIGFIVHIIYGTILTHQNSAATPKKYEVKQKTVTYTWASRNMFILGLLLLVFLVIHLIHFYVRMKITDTAPMDPVTGGHDGYKLVTDLFLNYGKVSYLYCALYVLGGILLGLHIRHGFWSAFQTIGWNNYVWKSRLFTLATIFAWVVGIGFSIIPIWVTFFIR